MPSVEKYKESAEHTDQDKGRIINQICELLWHDPEFYKTMVAYAKAAKGDLIG